jgi:hypothetical protein
VWVLGNHRLLCGDSTQLDAVEKVLAGGLADMVFTDPPHNAEPLRGSSPQVPDQSVQLKQVFHPKVRPSGRCRHKWIDGCEAGEVCGDPDLIAVGMLEEDPIFVPMPVARQHFKLPAAEGVKGMSDPKTLRLDVASRCGW